MHEEWRDDIPFYAAGSLDPMRRTALEKHLSSCAECRHYLDEWREIGLVVRSQAAQWSRGLPPLSERVRATVRAGQPISQAETLMAEPVVLPRVRSNPSKRRYLPMTLVASFMLVFAIVLLLMISFAPDEEDSYAGPGVAAASTETPTTARTPLDLLQQDYGILPSPTLTITPTASATATRRPVQPTAFATAFVPTESLNPPATTGGEEWLFSSAQCSASAVSDLGAQIVESPNVTENVVGFLSKTDRFSVNAYREPWVELRSPAGGIVGWARVSDVVLYGDCTAFFVEETQTPLAPAAIIDFSASLPQVVPGGSFTVTWDVSGVSAITLTYGEPSNSNSVLGQHQNLPANGSLEIIVPEDYPAGALEVILMVQDLLYGTTITETMNIDTSP